MGKRSKRERQEELWIAKRDIVETPGHVFYDRLNELLGRHRFDERVEHLCRRFYQGPYGRPSIAPGVYFRMMLVGYFEGLDSERGIAWRVADSLSLRNFLGYGLDEKTPDHSTISRTRRLYWLSTHQAVFRWALGVLAAEGLVRGETVSIDATTLEANAALRSIVRRENGQRYEEYLRRLAEEEGIEEPTREQLARFDRKRKKEGVESGLEASSGSGCADHEDEGRADALGLQGRARGGPEQWSRCGGDVAAGRCRGPYDALRDAEGGAGRRRGRGEREDQRAGGRQGLSQ